MLPTDAAQLKNDHHRSRLIIRICLASLFVLLILTVVGFIMFDSSENDIERAKAIYAQLNAQRNLSDFKSLLGKPHVALSHETFTLWSWQFRKHSLDQIECYNILLLWDDERGLRKLKCDTNMVKGWDVWKLRWYLVKEKIGL